MSLRKRMLEGLAARAANLTRSKAHPLSQLARLEPPPPPDVVISDYRTALRAIVDRNLLASAGYQRQQWRADRTRTHPDILLFEMLLVRRLAGLGVPVFCHTAYRSEGTQNDLYAKGHTRAKAGESPHNWGLAVDIVHSRLAWDMAKASWDVIGHVGKEVAAQNGIAVEWGGDWSFWDPAHWELSDWKSLKGWQF